MPLARLKTATLCGQARDPCRRPTSGKRPSTLRPSHPRQPRPAEPNRRLQCADPNSAGILLDEVGTVVVRVVRFTPVAARAARTDRHRSLLGIGLTHQTHQTWAALVLEAGAAGAVLAASAPGRPGAHAT